MADRGRAPARGPRGGPPPRGRPIPPSSDVNGSSCWKDSSKGKREAILDLSKYVNERIRVKFTGGREVTGILKGYDQLLNLVLDEVEEQINGAVISTPLLHTTDSRSTEPEPQSRMLNLVVLRGPTITLLSPVDGSEEIANPFVAQE
ncbi:U6 snRNA-associated Sm-like protein LSm7 [Suillus clintonianus]|uniref:U6 snRNA-associated Sm-like protein LSm7 n=1 Tax=Suillus clintonianus TaxID=1904413 RepID=UPI001B86BB5B|nr:U6 snRNA-associated Sm-like protein LSm7 [Suillus clintonianus]KAG2121303.1 U6 snRNA-associated Sm-like protein LSm7 [Suillus clintonianus]